MLEPLFSIKGQSGSYTDGVVRTSSAFSPTERAFKRSEFALSLCLSLSLSLPLSLCVSLALALFLCPSPTRRHHITEFTESPSHRVTESPNDRITEIPNYCILRIIAFTKLPGFNESPNHRIY